MCVNGGQEGQSSLNFYLFSPRPLKDSPKDACNQPPPTNTHQPQSQQLGNCKLSNFTPSSLWDQSYMGRCPQGHSYSWFSKLRTHRQQWYRELPAFSTANYRRESLRMFCKWQRETAEVFLQSQRNRICALPFLTPTSPSSYFHAPPSEPFSQFPLQPLLVEDFLLRFPPPPSLSLGLSRKGTDTENIFATVFHLESHSQAKGVGEGRDGRGWGGGGKKCFSQKLNLGVKKTAQSPYPHGPGMTKTRERKRSHLSDDMVSQI